MSTPKHNKTTEQKAAAENSKRAPQLTSIENPDGLDFLKRLRDYADDQTSVQKQVERGAKDIDLEYGKWAEGLSNEELTGRATAISNTMYFRALQQYLSTNEAWPSETGGVNWTQELLPIASDTLDVLRFLASKGNERAAFLFCTVLQVHVGRLNDDALKSPEIYQGTAHKFSTWPVLYSPRPSMSTDEAKLQAVLQIARDYIIDIKPKAKSGKQWSFNTPANRHAFHLIETMTWISSHILIGDFDQLIANCQKQGAPALAEWLLKCQKLPFFCKDSIKKWLEPAWDYVLILTNDHPEIVEDLKILGQDRMHLEPWEAPVKARIKEVIQLAMINWRVKRSWRFC